jgi:hypothetical protein
MSKKWNSELMLPSNDNFQLRVLEAKHSPSKSSGNLMITLNFEIVVPEEVEIDGELVNVTGVKVRPFYIITHVYSKTERDGNGNPIIDKELTVTKQKSAAEVLNSLGFESPYDWDNLGAMVAGLKGKIILAAVESEMVPKTKTPTSIQIQEGIARGFRKEQIHGDTMINPITKRPLVDYWPKIVSIFGISPDQSLAAAF